MHLLCVHPHIKYEIKIRSCKSATDESPRGIAFPQLQLAQSTLLSIAVCPAAASAPVVLCCSRCRHHHRISISIAPPPLHPLQPLFKTVAHTKPRRLQRFCQQHFFDKDMTTSPTLPPAMRSAATPRQADNFLRLQLVLRQQRAARLRRQQAHLAAGQRLLAAAAAVAARAEAARAETARLAAARSAEK